MRILFMGTPDFAVASLEALVEAGHEICGVFSQPDKPVGRRQSVLRSRRIRARGLWIGICPVDSKPSRAA